MFDYRSGSERQGRQSPSGLILQQTNYLTASSDPALAQLAEEKLKPGATFPEAVGGNARSLKVAELPLGVAFTM
jgi:hypothetical protein